MTEDRALVERCLNVSDQTTVSNTVARLAGGLLRSSTPPTSNLLLLLLLLLRALSVRRGPEQTRVFGVRVYHSVAEEAHQYR